MNISNHFWAKTLLAGTLVFTSLPFIAPHQSAYAATSQVVVSSTSDLTNQLYQSLMKRDAETTFIYKGNTSNLKSVLQDAFEQALEKDPYTQYILDSYGLSWRQTAYAAQVTVKMNYRETPAQTAYVQNKVKQVLPNLISSSMTDDEKVKTIHDWVVRNLKYDETYTRYTAYEALHDGTAVCQGYALLTYEMLKQAGIENMIVEGKAGDELHAWNLVHLNGSWYHMDTTWDDPVPDLGDNVQTDYYLLTDAQMKKDHSWTKTYPAASTTYENALNQLITTAGPKTAVYQKLASDLDYVASGASINSASGLKDVVQQSQNQGKEKAVFRYAGALSSLKSDLKSLSSIGIRSVSYNVQTLNNNNDLKVTLYWR